MSQKMKTTILIILGLLIIWFVLAIFMAPDSKTTTPQANNQAAETAADNAKVTEPPLPPAFQASEKRYEVLAVKADDAYQARDLADNKELEVFLPSDAIVTAGQIANIEPGTILTVQKFMELANGVVITELSISTKE